MHQDEVVLRKSNELSSYFFLLFIHYISKSTKNEDDLIIQMYVMFDVYKAMRLNLVNLQNWHYDTMYVHYVCIMYF